MALGWRLEYRRYQEYLRQLSGQKKARTYAGLIITLLTITFFLIFAIKPTLITITALIRELKDQRLVAQKLQAKINALREAQQEYSLIENDLPLIDQALPKEPQLSTLVKQIETLTQHSGVTLEGVSFTKTPLKRPTPEKNKERGKVSTINLNLTLSGDYQNLKKFLHNLIFLRRIIVIESLAFKPQRKKEAKLLTLNLKLKTYYLRGLNKSER